MKKILIIMTLLITILVTGCQSNSTISKERLSNDYKPLARGFALEFLDLDSTKMGFKAVGNNADLESADYIVDKMTEIGLSNVAKDEIVLDGWAVKDAVLTIFCDCDTSGRLDIKAVGYYPTNMSFNQQKFNLFDVANGDEVQYQGKNVSGHFVILATQDNLLDNIERAKSKGVAGVLVSSGHLTDIDTLIIEDFPTDIPVLSVSENTLSVARQYLKDGFVGIELTANSQLSEDNTTYIVSGEIKGKNKNETIYVTASRDGLYKDFMGSAVSISELLFIADELVKDSYKPNSTIKFVVTTGQDWGRIGQAENEGLKALLESKPEWLDQAKAAIVLDGSYPTENNIITETQGSNEILDFLNAYNTKFDEKGYRFTNNIKEINDERVTEALVWQGEGVPTILQAEPKDSAYSKLEGTSGDKLSLKIDNEQLNFLVDYYMNIIKEIDKVGSFK